MMSRAIDMGRKPQSAANWVTAYSTAQIFSVPLIDCFFPWGSCDFGKKQTEGSILKDAFCAALHHVRRSRVVRLERRSEDSI